MKKGFKIGLKLWSTNGGLIKEAERLVKDGVFDYVELMVIPNTDILPFQNVKLPYIIHIPHESFGLNIADPKNKELNLKIMNQSIEWADKLSAKYLILHPGSSGKMDAVKNFLEKISDKRILIENMPKVGINDEKMIGFTPEQIKELMEEKFGFCLDFGHATKAALSLGVDYKKYIREFLILNPKVFHISDGMISPGKDEHLNIGQGEYDIGFLLDCVENNDSKLTTLETPRNNLNSLKEDLENIKKLIS